MKGLIKHNLYAVESTLKGYLCGVLLSILAICCFRFIVSDATLQTIANFASYVIMGSFAGLPFTLLHNLSKSQWTRFELTLPITRKDVIKSRYLSFLIFTCFALVSFLLLNLVNYLLGIDLNLDIFFNFYTLTTCFILCLAVPAFLHPLTLICGIDKGEILFFISVACALIVCSLLPMVLFGQLIASMSSTIVSLYLFQCSSILLSFALFVGSYFISQKIYARQDL